MIETIDRSAASQPETIDLVAIEAELRPQSSEKLRSRFYDCTLGVARLIGEAAVCVKLLKERGEPINVPLARTYLAIADGRVLPELVSRFIESPGRVIVEQLPLADQKRLAADPVVPVVEPAESGYTTRMVDLAKAPKDVVKLAIGPEGVRTPDEQKAFLATTRRVASATQKAAPEDTPGEPLTRQITVRLTETEFKTLAARALETNPTITPAAMARRLLLQADVFRKAKG